MLRAYGWMRKFYLHSAACRMQKHTSVEGISKDNLISSEKTTQTSSHAAPLTTKLSADQTKLVETVLPSGLSQAQQIPLETTTHTGADVDKEQEEVLKVAAPFNEMPGPLILKYLAKGWSYIPQISNQFTTAAMAYFMNMLGRIDAQSQGGASLIWNRGVAPFMHMFEKYGPVVRLQGVFGGDIVFVARPDHIEKVYREEGKYPLRSALDSLERYRSEHRKQSIAGPFVTFGPDWESLRSKIEVPFMKSVSHFGPHLEVIADDFIKNLRTLLNRQEETPADFDKEIFKWSFESVALVTLGRRMHLVGPQKLLPGSVGLNLMEAMLAASTALRRCESGFQMWRIISTPAWSSLTNACQTIDSIVLKFIRETENRFHTTRLGLNKEDSARKNVEEEENLVLDSDISETSEIRPVPLLEYLMVEGGMAAEDMLTVLLDVLLLGTNATAHALSFLIYHMAKRPRAQKQLFDELAQVMPQPNARLAPHIKGDHLQGLTYLKACLRESLRMNPPIPVLTRILPKDIILHNYRVPEGTMVLMATHVAGMKEENFEDARKFKPERWLGVKSHPFASLPYGHGPRCCVARHLADIQILLTAAKIFRTYRAEYNYGNIHPTNRLIAMPNKPLKFSFIERS